MTASPLSIGDASIAISALPSLSAKLGANANIDKTAQGFEEMFATQLLQPMFEGVGVNQTFGGGHGEEVMRSFLTQEYGKMVAKSGKLGIAAQVKTQMLRAQESASHKQMAALPNAASAAYATAQGGNNVSVQ